jgi:hypothetical protein
MIILIGIYYLITPGAFKGVESYKSSVMIFKIEKKEHHIEPGKFIKMWVIGSNANDNSPNKERYKVIIEDSRIYNLLKEGNEYFVNIEGVKKKNQSKYIYTFGQLGLADDDATQLTGKGKIE